MAEKKYIIDNAKLMAEWDWEKNNKLGFDPNETTTHSGKKGWWICANGHSFDATFANRSNGKSCPYCSGHKVMSGINDLATLYPDIAKEWNSERNGDLLPSMVSPGSSKKLWWKCRKGHEWQTVINSRTIQRTGCPICRLEQQTSFPEQAILFYCSQVTPSKSRNMDFGKEIDIYLPKYRIGIEYNGIFWHKNKNDVDRRKVNFFADKNIRIITIAESNQNNVSGDTIEYVYSSSNKDSLNWAIQGLLKTCNNKVVKINTYPVIYDKAKQKDIVRSFLKQALEFYNIHKNEIKNIISDFLLDCGLIFKSEHFKHEEEVRIIVDIPKSTSETALGNNFFEVKYRVSYGYVVPYIELKIPKECLGMVTLGPKLHHDESNRTQQIVLLDWLKANDYNNVTVTNSCAPIRY